MLQQITDTLEDAEAAKHGKDPIQSAQSAGSDQTDAKQQQQQQAYGRGAGTATQQQDMGEGQLRRLQLSNEDKALMNRVKTQGMNNEERSIELV